jgi:hypothetical protein
MNKFNAGKASILALTAVFAVAAFLLGKSFSTVDGSDKVLMHHDLGNGKCQQKYLPAQVAVTPEWELGGCETEVIYGCKDPIANNYDESATDADNSLCTYDSKAYCSDGEDISVPDNQDPPQGATLGECEGNGESPSPEATPGGDLCTNIDGVQTSVPDGMHINATGHECVNWELGGPQSSNGTGGQVLGASTMAGTGSFAEDLYLAIMGLGGIITALGIKNFKKGYKVA